EAAEVGLEAYDRFQPYKGGRPHVRLSRAEALALEPGLTPRVIGALTMDEWGVDAGRLVATVALGAVEAGAELRTWTEVVGLRRDPGGAVTGVRVRSRLGGAEETLGASLVVNAAGPWAEELAA